MTKAREIPPFALILPFVCAIFFIGIDWGLPSRDVDSKLFGDRTPWTGAEILALLEDNKPSSATVGADVDATPILDRSKPIILNDTDAKRAEIVQRYRLMSGQPDEFIQFKALAEMAGRSGVDRFDPRLYQYGGLWIYPVGALLKVCSLVGLVELKSDRAFYLDHPEAFGRFYVVARCYSAMWGLVLVWAAFQITKKITNNQWLALVAAILLALTPVVMSSAQEAKPHLAGTALTLLAVLAASRHIETGKAKWSLLACLLCACAASMVLSAVLSCAMLPMMVWLGRKNRTTQKPIWKDMLRLFEMFVLVGILFTLFNPFLIYNGLFRPEFLKSNLGNSAAMYGVSIQGIWHAIEILGAAMTWVVMICAVTGAIVLVFRRVRFNAPSGQSNEIGVSRHALQLLVVTMLPTLVMFILLANEKPMEFARFGIMLIPAAIAIVFATLRFLPARIQCITAGIVLFFGISGAFSHLIGGLMYRAASEHFVATLLTHLKRPTVGLWYEPAPWSAPPINLFESKIVLLPPGNTQPCTLFLAPGNLPSPIDNEFTPQRISWMTNSWNNWPNNFDFENAPLREPIYDENGKLRFFN